MMFEKMWAVAEWPGERRSAAMAAAAEKLKLGICCLAGSLLDKAPCGVSSAIFDYLRKHLQWWLSKITLLPRNDVRENVGIGRMA